MSPLPPGEVEALAEHQSPLADFAQTEVLPVRHRGALPDWAWSGCAGWGMGPIGDVLTAPFRAIFGMVHIRGTGLDLTDDSVLLPSETGAPALAAAAEQSEMGVEWEPAKDPSDALHNGTFFRNEAAIRAWRPMAAGAPPPVRVRPAVAQRTWDIITRVKAAGRAADGSASPAAAARGGTEIAEAGELDAAFEGLGGEDAALVVRAASAALAVRLGDARAAGAIAALMGAAAAAVVRDARRMDAAQAAAADAQLARMRAADIAARACRDADHKRRQEQLRRAETRLREEREQVAREREALDERRASALTAAEQASAAAAREREELARERAALDAQRAQSIAATEHAAAAAARDREQISRERAALDAQLAQAAAERERARAWKRRDGRIRGLEQEREIGRAAEPEPESNGEVEERRALVPVQTPGTPPDEVFVELSPAPRSPERRSPAPRSRGRPPLAIAPAPALDAQSGALVVRRAPSSARKSEADRLRLALAYTPWTGGSATRGAPDAELSASSSRRRARAAVKREVGAQDAAAESAQPPRAGRKGAAVSGSTSRRRMRKREAELGDGSVEVVGVESGNSEKTADVQPPQKRRRESGTPTTKKLLPAFESPSALVVNGAVVKKEDKRREKKVRSKKSS